MAPEITINNVQRLKACTWVVTKGMVTGIWIFMDRLNIVRFFIL